MREQSYRIRTLWRTFQRDWEECQQVWQDAVTRRFESDFVTPWQPLLEELCQRLETLDRVLHKAIESYINT
jgi:uncharacterized protein YukE